MLPVWPLSGWQNSDGEWSTATNWDGGVIADGADNTAYFGITGLGAPPINSTNAVFTLDGARTIGNINFYTTNAPANWTLTTGSGGPLTLSTTFDIPAIYVTPSKLQLTVNAVLAGTNGLEATGPGMLVLTAANTYTGGTTVTAGAPLVNGTLSDINPVIVSSETSLGGTRAISGPLVIQSGGAFSPGNPLRTFTVNNSLTLQASTAIPP